MKAFVTGVGGQLGHDVMNELAKRGYDGVGSDILPSVDTEYPYVQLDITDAAAVEKTISGIKPDVVIHCAAWTAVDAAEDEENKPKVKAINVDGTQNIANVCKKIGCKMIYISTDYVFNGQGTEPWRHDCKDYAPQNVYGQSKLDGELAVSNTLDKYFIVRIAWVFGINGKNFIKTMINVGKTHDEVRVVCDQIGTPTYTFDLARLLVDMAETEKYGYYHATNEGGYISWYDFTVEIYKQAGMSTKVTPVTTAEYGLSKAVRPFNSRLDKSKLAENGFTPLPTWQDALSRYLREILTIDELIKNGFVVVFDTNVLLNVYRYSPDFSDFALECMKSIMDSIVLPATVRLEYERHRMAGFANMKKRLADVGKETEMQINRAKDKIISSCSTFKRLQYGEADELIALLNEKMDAVSKALTDYFDEHASLDLIQRSWGETDYLFSFIQVLDNNNQIMPQVSQEDIYRWCDDGETRYKKLTPPGFEDAKNKDGVRKYSDLIMWREMLLYAKKHSKSIIFVTDDVKSDWYEKNGADRKFHSKLLSEFSETGQTIVPMTSKQFLSEVSEAYGIEQSDAVEIALRMTDESYFNSVYYSVFESVMDQLVYNASDYIDDSTAHIGSEGIDEFEITDDRFDSAVRIEREDDMVIYEFTYFVALSGTSYEYWGRDDDTREIITSPGRDHEFEGYITVRVEREVQAFFDFEDDNSFDSVEIVSGDIKETSYSDRYDGSDDFEEIGELGNCPDCGVPLNIDNDCSGFCTECAKKRD